MVGLEDEAEVLRARDDAGGGLEKPPEDVEKRRLAGTRTPDDRDLLAFADREVDTLQDLDGLLPRDLESLSYV